MPPSQTAAQSVPSTPPLQLSPSLLEWSSSVLSAPRPMPVWTLFIPMVSVLCIDFLLQIAATTLSSSDDLQDGTPPDRTVHNTEQFLPIAQIAVDILTGGLYCTFIYPNTLTHIYSTMTHHRRPSTTKTRRSTVDNARMGVVAILATAYVYFAAQGIYNNVHHSQRGFMGWVIVVLNISMVLLLAIDCRIQWRNRVDRKQAPLQMDPIQDYQQQRALAEMRMTGSTTWTEIGQDTLPRYETSYVHEGRSIGADAPVYAPQAAVSMSIPAETPESDEQGRRAESIVQPGGEHGSEQGPYPSLSTPLSESPLCSS
ncbi:hypothetical protein BC939DRAFT_327203 [Gamsiella multidivaricata]|uniref:uncharacterized protein n=1 Tax=Gamsiella multidivaricata TaxID=101098 RepID=UPI00221F193B|nr:uncharacterized protein BC939DRAFT_327203 [Gamsiella multidivaricata]KAI7817508.1 hypothetical protein BC939DRAFT_327203 [Gamsiella multidivaricata]